MTRLREMGWKYFNPNKFKQGGVFGANNWQVKNGVSIDKLDLHVCGIVTLVMPSKLCFTAKKQIFEGLPRILIDKHLLQVLCFIFSTEDLYIGHCNIDFHNSVRISRLCWTLWTCNLNEFHYIVMQTSCWAADMFAIKSVSFPLTLLQKKGLECQAYTFRYWYLASGFSSRTKMHNHCKLLGKNKYKRQG